MTLKEILKKYPLHGSKVAQKLNYSREWLAGLSTGRMVLTPKKREQHLRMIEKYLREIGQELSQITITDE